MPKKVDLQSTSVPQDIKRIIKGYSHPAQGEYHNQANLVPLTHLQLPDTRVRQAQNGNIAQYLRDGEPQQRPLARIAGQGSKTLVRADEALDQQEY